MIHWLIGCCMRDWGDSMGELTQAEGVYSQQAWRTVLNWLGFFFRMFSEIIGGAFSYYPLVSFSFSSSHHYHPFKPLPPIDQHQHQPLQIASLTNDHDNRRPLQKLTVCYNHPTCFNGFCFHHFQSGTAQNVFFFFVWEVLVLLS